MARNLVDKPQPRTRCVWCCFVCRLIMLFTMREHLDDAASSAHIFSQLSLSLFTGENIAYLEIRGQSCCYSQHANAHMNNKHEYCMLSAWMNSEAVYRRKHTLKFIAIRTVDDVAQH